MSKVLPYRCPICHNLPKIANDNGIGRIYCPRCYDPSGDKLGASFSFSGKSHTNMNQAIAKWNDYVCAMDKIDSLHDVVFYTLGKEYTVHNVSHVAYDANRLLLYIPQNNEIFWAWRHEYESFRII